MLVKFNGNSFFRRMQIIPCRSNKKLRLTIYGNYSPILSSVWKIMTLVQLSEIAKTAKSVYL